MIRRSTQVVVAVFLALLALALILGRRPDEPEVTETNPTPEPIWSVESSEVEELIVENLDEQLVLELVRDEDDLWKLLRPEEMAADPARVERAVSWLASPQPRAVIADVSDLSAFELDAPHYRVRLSTTSGEQLEFTVGREAPTGGTRYALTDDQPGVLVFSSVGLDEVLQLAPDLIPTPTPEPTATAAPTATAQPEG